MVGGVHGRVGRRGRDGVEAALFRRLVAARRDAVNRAGHAGVAGLLKKRAVIYFGWAFFLILSGSPHVRPMRRARRNRIDRHGGEIERLGTRTFQSKQVQVALAWHFASHSSKDAPPDQ